MRHFAFLAVLVGSALSFPFVPKSTNSLLDVPSRRDLISNGINPNATDNVLNSANFGKINVAQAGNQLRISLVNNLNGGQVNAYVNGRTRDGRWVFLGPDGQYVYVDSRGSASDVPVAGKIAIPLSQKGGKIEVTLPDHLIGGRIWFAEGELKFASHRHAVTGREELTQPSHVSATDPSVGTNWGFVEFNWDGNLYANLSFVDFVGIMLGMKLTSNDGYDRSVPGMKPGAVANICKDLEDQARSDGQPWNKLCVKDSRGNPLRVLSPMSYVSPAEHANEFSGYYTNYIDEVWRRYANEPIQVDTPGVGMVNCRVNGNEMRCDHADKPFTKPTITDIWGCSSGTFSNTGSDAHKAIAARLCAAFVRTTLLLPGGNVQPKLDESNYYKNNPTHHYSRIVHKYQVNSIGYAFSYDDVHPSGGVDTSGTLSHGNPNQLTFFIGGM